MSTQASPNIAPTYEAGSAPTFRERVYALAGHSTWRGPSDGVRGEQKAIPADHLVVAALAFGRMGQNDIGPDIAFDIATGRSGHQRKVCLWLGAELARERSGPGKRLRPWAAHYATWAYNAMVHGWQFPLAPEGVADKDHGEVALFACLMLERAAEDALALAARRARAA